MEFSEKLKKKQEINNSASAITVPGYNSFVDMSCL